MGHAPCVRSFDKGAVKVQKKLGGGGLQSGGKRRRGQLSLFCFASAVCLREQVFYLSEASGS